MIIKNKARRAFVRGWCRRHGLQYSRNVWFVRRQSDDHKRAAAKMAKYKGVGHLVRHTVVL